MKCRVKSERQLQKERDKACKSMSPITVAALLSVADFKLHFGYEKMQKFAKAIMDSYDSISQKYVTFEDLKECLETDDDVKIPFSMDYQKCETVDDAISIAAYTQKAFGSAVISTVLCDKFWFKSKKVEQCVKWFCDSFDLYLNDRKALNEVNHDLFVKYDIIVT